MGVKIKFSSIFITLLCTVFIFSGCVKEKKESILSFDIKNTPDSVSLYINKNGVTSDSVMLINGKGIIKTQCKNAEQILISNYDLNNKSSKINTEYRFKFLWIENSDINITGDYNHFQNLNISGSESENINNELRLIENKYEASKDSLTQLFHVFPHFPSSIRQEFPLLVYLDPRDCIDARIFKVS